MRRGGGPKNSLCSYKGIRQKKSGKWVAEFRIPHRSKSKGSNSISREWLGTFSTLEEAVNAYNSKSIQFSGAPAYSLDYNSGIGGPSYSVASRQYSLSTSTPWEHPSSCTSLEMQMGFSPTLQLHQPPPVPQKDVILRSLEVPENEKLFSVSIDWLMSPEFTPHIPQLSTAIVGTNLDLPQKKYLVSTGRTEVFPADKHTGNNGDGMWVLDGHGSHEFSLSAENSREEISVNRANEITCRRTTWVEGGTWRSKETQVSIPRANTYVDEVDRNSNKELNVGDGEDYLSNLCIMVEDGKWSSSELEKLIFSVTVLDSDITPTTAETYSDPSNVTLKGLTEISTSKNEQVNESVPREERSPPMVPNETAFHEDTPWSGDNQLDGTSNCPLDDSTMSFNLMELLEQIY